MDIDLRERERESNTRTLVCAHTLTHLILPLKFCPHFAELLFGAGGGQYIVHDIDVYIVENDTITIRS